MDGGVTSSTFSGNKALSGSGGALFAPNLVGGITDSTFTGNEADHDGGAVFAAYTFQGGITRSTFTNNMAKSPLARGGVLYALGFAGDITDSTFSGNESGFRGGAIYIHTGFAGGVTNSTFNANKADSGGAFYLLEPGAVRFADSTFTGNTAATLGGAIFVNTTQSSTSVTSHDIEFIANNGKTLLFSDNTAAGKASAIHFGKTSGDRSNRNASLAITPAGGGTVELRDPITADIKGVVPWAPLTTPKTFTLTVSGPGTLLWGGTNDLDADGGSTVTIANDTAITLLSDFQLGNLGKSVIAGPNNGDITVTFADNTAIGIDLRGRPQGDALPVFAKGTGAYTINGGVTFSPYLQTFDVVDASYLLVDAGVAYDLDAFAVTSGFGSYEIAQRNGRLYLDVDNSALLDSFLFHENGNVSGMYASGALQAEWERYRDESGLTSAALEPAWRDVVGSPENYLAETVESAAFATLRQTGRIMDRAFLMDSANYQAWSAASERAYGSFVGYDGYSRGIRFWGGYLGGREDISASGGQSGYDTRFNGFAVGGSLDISRGVSWGAYFAHGIGHADSDAARARIRSKTNMLGQRLTLRPSACLTFDLDAYFAHVGNDSERSNHFGRYTALYDQRTWGVGLRAGCRFSFANGLTLTPWADARFQRLTQDGMVERGTEWFALRQSGTSGNSFGTRLGADVGYRFALGGGRSVTPSARAAWRHEFGDTRLRSSGGFVGSLPEFVTRSAARGRDDLELGVNVNAVLYECNGKSVSFEGGYDFSLSKDYRGHFWRAGLAVGF